VLGCCLLTYEISTLQQSTRWQSNRPQVISLEHVRVWVRVRVKVSVRIKVRTRVTVSIKARFRVKA